MIRRLRGQLLERELTSIVIDVGGVGYGVAVSPQTASLLPEEGGRVDLWIHTNVYADGIDLYGFVHPNDRAVFVALTGVSNIGPRLAMNILSGMDPADLVQAVAAGDLARLVRIPGVGKKTAERMVLELKDRFADLLRRRAAAENPTLEATREASLEDVRSALLNLGYKPATVSKIIPLLTKPATEGASLQSLLREGLRLLQKG